MLFLSHSQIDKGRWNETIERSLSPRIYAMSWYLDVVSPGWEALVSEDYSYVIPLPVKKRWGYKYVGHPPLTKQLGLFSTSQLDSSTIQQALQSIPYSNVHLLWGGENPIEGLEPTEINMSLSLNAPIETLRSAYQQNTQRNVRRSGNGELTFYEVEPDDLFVDKLFLHNPHFNSSLRPLVSHLIAQCQFYGEVHTWVVSDHTGKWLAGTCWLVWGGRSYFLFPFTSPVGKEFFALFALVDSYIAHHSGSELTLDFEGSNVPSIYRFYKGFGAKEEHFYRYIKKAWWRW